MLNIVVVAAEAVHELPVDLGMVLEVGQCFAGAVRLTPLTPLSSLSERAGRDVLSERGEEVVGSLRDRQLLSR